VRPAETASIEAAPNFSASTCAAARQTSTVRFGPGAAWSGVPKEAMASGVPRT
jgi:hypothetical protein